MGRASNKELQVTAIDQNLIVRRPSPVAAESVRAREFYKPGVSGQLRRELANLDKLFEEGGKVFNPRASSRAVLRRYRMMEMSKNALRNELESSFGAYINGRRQSGSSIVDAEMLDAFGVRIAAAHVFNGSVLEKTTFERQFVATLNATGRIAYKTKNPTHPGEDVVIDGVPYSLKTEGAKRAKPGVITISKLMEAAWCQGLTSRQQAVDLIPRVLEHLSRYKRILVLRNLDASLYDAEIEPETVVRYSLVEIPHPVIEEMRELKARDFTPPRRTRKGSTTAYVKVDGESAFTLRFDGSQGKVTITNLNMDLCRLHAQWDVTHPEALLRRADWFEQSMKDPAAGIVPFEKGLNAREALLQGLASIPDLTEDMVQLLSSAEGQAKLAERLNEAFGDSLTLSDRLLGLLSDVGQPS